MRVQDVDYPILAARFDRDRSQILEVQCVLDIGNSGGEYRQKFSRQELLDLLDNADSVWTVLKINGALLHM